MHQIFYITPNPEHALGVEELIPSFHILHSDLSQLTIPITNRGVDIKNFPILSDTTKESKVLALLEDEKLQKYIKSLSHDTPNIIVSQNSKQIEELAKKLGFNLLNPKFQITDSLSNPKALSKFIQESEIFPESTKSNENRFVYTVVGCITRLGIIVGGISEELRNIPLLSNSKDKSLGNDYSQRHLNDYLRADLISKTTELGNALMKLGHSGIFSIDVEFSPEENILYR
jgi:hypothetical protein